MERELEGSLSRRNFLKVLGLTGAAATGLAVADSVLPHIQYKSTTTPEKLRSQFTQEQLEAVGENEQVDTKMGTMYLDLPAKLRTPDELKQGILDTKDNPSLIGVSWGKAAGLRTWTTSEDSFYTYLLPKGKSNNEDIISLRVPFPIDTNDDELTKFTDGTYKFDINLLKWVRMNDSQFETYEILEVFAIGEPTQYARIYEGWRPRKRLFPKLKLPFELSSK